MGHRNSKPLQKGPQSGTMVLEKVEVVVFDVGFPQGFEKWVHGKSFEGVYFDWTKKMQTTVFLSGNVWKYSKQKYHCRVDEFQVWQNAIFKAIIQFNQELLAISDIPVSSAELSVWRRKTRYIDAQGQIYSLEDEGHL